MFVHPSKEPDCSIYSANAKPAATRAIAVKELRARFLLAAPVEDAAVAEAVADEPEPEPDPAVPVAPALAVRVGVLATVPLLLAAVMVANPDEAVPVALTDLLVKTPPNKRASIPLPHHSSLGARAVRVVVGRSGRGEGRNAGAVGAPGG